MTSSGLVRLMVLTAVVVGAWLFTSGDGGGAPADGAGPWLTELAEHVNDVTSLELVTGGERFTVTQGADGWVLDDWGGYPVSFEHVAATVVALSELSVQDAMTSRAEKHAQLQLEDPTGEAAASVGLTLRDGGEAVLADVILGKAKGSTGLFVRRTGEDQTWLVSGSVAPPREPSGWVETELMRLAAADVTRVECEPADTEAYALVKDEAGAWTLESLPAGRTLATSAPSAQVAGALSWLELEAVADPQQAAAERTWSTTRFHGADGLVTEVVTAETEEGDGAWLRLAFSAAPEPPAAEEEAETEGGAAGDLEGGDPGDGEGQAAEAPAPPDTSAQDLADRAAELTARHAPWTYRIASWKAGLLRKDLAAYFEPLPEPGPPSEPEGGEAEAPADGAPEPGGAGLEDPAPVGG
jgi:hypothetical protein